LRKQHAKSAFEKLVGLAFADFDKTDWRLNLPVLDPNPFKPSLDKNR